MAKKKVSKDANRLFYGDNLEVLRRTKDFPDESVDLVYLDPPFNSDENYSVFLKDAEGHQAAAQLSAFEDTWRWSPETDRLYSELITSVESDEVSKVLQGLYEILGKCDLMAYMVMMAPRLIEMRRVLKDSGSLWLHCDPTASHYLKILLDAIFGTEMFRNEIVWHYSGWNKKLRDHYERRHDTILVYAKSHEMKFNSLTTPWASEDEYVKTRKQKVHTDPNGDRYVLSDAGGGKRIKRYLHDAMAYGKPQDDVWDIPKLNNSAAESLGYPTQKPEALLRRVIQTATDEDDVVLDPFCGCGTTVDAAEGLGRKWIGIDISYLAIDLITKRMSARYGAQQKEFITLGIPTDMDSARALFDLDDFEFERWAVALVGGLPKEKRGPDKGKDGTMRVPAKDMNKTETILISVKGGKDRKRAHVDELEGALSTHGAVAGILICLEKPTKGMLDAARTSGTYTHELTGRTYPKIQVISVADLFDGKRPNLPAPLTPYRIAARKGDGKQLDLGLPGDDD